LESCQGSHHDRIGSDYNALAKGGGGAAAAGDPIYLLVAVPGAPDPPPCGDMLHHGVPPSRPHARDCLRVWAVVLCRSPNVYALRCPAQPVGPSRNARAPTSPPQLFHGGHGEGPHGGGDEGFFCGPAHARGLCANGTSRRLGTHHGLASQAEGSPGACALRCSAPPYALGLLLMEICLQPGETAPFHFVAFCLQPGATAPFHFVACCLQPGATAPFHFVACCLRQPAPCRISSMRETLPDAANGTLCAIRGSCAQAMLGACDCFFPSAGLGRHSGWVCPAVPLPLGAGVTGSHTRLRGQERRQRGCRCCIRLSLLDSRGISSNQAAAEVPLNRAPGLPARHQHKTIKAAAHCVSLPCHVLCWPDRKRRRLASIALLSMAGRAQQSKFGLTHFP